MTEQVKIQEDAPLVINDGLLKFFRAQGKIYTDLIGVYMFLLETRQWQKTNQIYATATYIKEHTHLSRERVTNSINKLVELGLIKKLQRLKNGKFDKEYIRIVHAMKMKTIEKKVEEVNKLNDFIDEGKAIVLDKKLSKDKNINSRNTEKPQPENQQHTKEKESYALRKEEAQNVNRLKNKFLEEFDKIYRDKFSKVMYKPSKSSLVKFTHIIQEYNKIEVIGAYKEYLKDKSNGLIKCKHHVNIFIAQFGEYLSKYNNDPYKGYVEASKSNNEKETENRKKIKKEENNIALTGSNNCNAFWEKIGVSPKGLNKWKTFKNPGNIFFNK